jgi:soluble lytic murein transglycosylase-like protein
MSDATDTGQGIGLILFLATAVAVGVLIWQAPNIGDDVEAAVGGWANVEEGPTWVPVINQSESANGIPTNMLAYMAYMESHFRDDIITGETPSSAGALGILQLMPQYFSSVQVATPFTTSDTVSQIQQAAQQLASLYSTFNDWTLAAAAYNWGAGNVQKYLAGNATLPAETQAYVNNLVGAVSITGQLA